jgi:hypothetical protein
MKPIDRRNLLQYLLAIGGGAAAYSVMHMNTNTPVGATNPKDFDPGTIGQAHHSLGDWIYLTPQKLGGGTHAVDMLNGRGLAWISYWNYGDTCPISHHLAAYPSKEPRKSFEFVNSTQGGMNVMIYGLPTQIKSRGILDRYGQGNNIYRVKYVGNGDGHSGQMELLENVAETTGLGLGVHTTIYPDGKGFACADGQKDVCAFFNRPPDGQKTSVLKDKHDKHLAYRADWSANNKRELDRTWSEGGTLRLTRLEPAFETQKFDFEGTTGNKIDWEMVPMAESLVWTGRLPGDSVRTLTGLDAVVHHPNNRFSALILRMAAAALIIDRETGEPVTCLHTPKGSGNNLHVRQVASSPEAWEVKFDDCKCVAHEAGFNPIGTNFVMMNNLKQNNVAVFDTSAPDPKSWRLLTHIEDSTWRDEFPCPFHLCFSVNGDRMFLSVLDKKPASSHSYVVDTATWTIKHRYMNIGPDCQTMAVTYDGEYVLQIFSGFQRLSCGLFIYPQKGPFDAKPIGYLPNFGGHHDCVIIPRNEKDLLNSRCTTL